MAEESVDRINRKQMLSALADGELDADEVRAACQVWRDDEAARRQWHAYQLIGDVMRSDDLAAPPRRDEAFLAALRDRLAQEPTVLAPTPTPAPATAPAVRRRAWAAPVAVAAGFVAVAGVLVVTRLSAPVADPAAAPALASNAPPALTLAADGPRPAASDGARSGPVTADDARILRDARLDRYLAAHKQYGAQSAAVVPVVSLRHATLAPER